MFKIIAKKIFGTANDRVIKSAHHHVEKINALESAISALTDEALRAKTTEFKDRISGGQSLDDILEEAFAVTREAAKRVMNMRHFDVQLLGGIILHRGMIAEMKTGEGKTLAATLPAYLNSLSGKGVHLVTVNDYLAQRDSEWMGAIYKFLGLSVGCIINDLDDDQRRAAYNCDVVYGTNNEFGFDYLRDNMKFSRQEMVQRGFNYAIVDEVDSILIDEARTPLVISGPTEENSVLYQQINKIIPMLKETDYEIDEKARTITLSDEGTENIEQILREQNLLEEGSILYDINSISLIHHISQALKAHKLFSSDVDYIVKEGKVVIIDEFTGRMMDGRRYSDGLHQALEAKEHVAIQNENQTLASITFQNYFRLYDKLAGMTGTAMTEASEFSDIYKLSVVEIPPNRKVARIDEDDNIYRTAQEKYDSIIKQIEECHSKKQPVLVGTVSIEKSEYVAKLLKKKKIKHNILNAKNHEKEAHIIAQAGKPGAVTIATNMAGRGTDIKLGGNAEMLIFEEIKNIEDEGKIESIRKKIIAQVERDEEVVKEAGGLYVLATERHESRRIDNQLRGRAGRQGDPGTSKFFLSLEDDLMRIFGSDKISNLLKTLGLKDGESITHPWISKAIEKAQMRVEQHNYDIRKSLLKFDDVMNDQRKVIYEQRIDIMEREDVESELYDMIDDVVTSLVSEFIPERSYFEQWDTENLAKEIFRIFGLHMPVVEWAKQEGIAEQGIIENIKNEISNLIKKKEEKYGADFIHLAEKKILLITLDQLWKEHLLGLDHLRQGIGLRAYGQKDPLNEYKREAFEAFNAMMNNMRETFITRICHMEFNVENLDKNSLNNAPANNRRNMNNGLENSSVKLRRNDPCPCGSGKKFKHCHGDVR